MAPLTRKQSRDSPPSTARRSAQKTRDSILSSTAERSVKRMPSKRWQDFKKVKKAPLKRNIRTEIGADVLLPSLAGKVSTVWLTDEEAKL